MNSRTAIMMTSAGLAGLTAACFLSLTPASSLAQNALDEAPAAGGPLTVTTPRVEQYKVVDISTVPVGRNTGGPAGTLENVLNSLAAEGWKLREASGNYLIFAR